MNREMILRLKNVQKFVGLREIFEDVTYTVCQIWEIKHQKLNRAVGNYDHYAEMIKWR